MDLPFMIEAIDSVRKNLAADRLCIVVVRDKGEYALLRKIFAPVQTKEYVAGLCLPSTFIAQALSNQNMADGVKLCLVDDSNLLYQVLPQLREFVPECFSIIFTYPIPPQLRNFHLLLKGQVQTVQIEFPEWWGEHPRANTPWTETEENELRHAVMSGMTLRGIARRHGRQLGGIESRIGKLFGPDFVYPGQQELSGV